VYRCQLYYNVVNDALHISDLTGNMSTFGSISLLNPNGTLGDVVNSNCQVLGTGSKVTFPRNVSA
jgi:filamentous hemagglutinin family protein